jgi:hypothetical protein
MNSLEIEPETILAQNYVHSFFSKLPADGTKYRTEYSRFIPATGFKERTSSITFIIPPLDPPFAYEIGRILISVKIVIKNAATDALPAATDQVCGGNLIFPITYLKKLSSYW